MNLSITKLMRLIDERNLYIALSLNPVPSYMPNYLGNDIDSISKFNKIIIDSVSEMAGAVCLDSNEYERYGSSGINVFSETLNYITKKGLFAISEGTTLFECDGAIVSPYGKIVPDIYVTRSSSSGTVYFMHINSFDRDFESKMANTLEKIVYCTYTGNGFCNIGLSIVPENATRTEMFRDAFDDCFFIVEPPTKEFYTEAVRCCFRRDGLGAAIKTDSRFFKNCFTAEDTECLIKTTKKEFQKWNRRAEKVLKRKAYPVYF